MHKAMKTPMGSTAVPAHDREPAEDADESRQHEQAVPALLVLGDRRSQAFGQQRGILDRQP
jgi:hypothetical protein